MKIVVLDGYTTNPGDLSWDFLYKLGDAYVYDRTPPEKIIERATGAEILVTNKTPITRETIDALPTLKFVALLSTGYNIADYVYLKEKGIPVSNIPAYSTDGVAQLVMAFLLELAMGVGLHDQSVKKGEWTTCRDFCYWKAPLTELVGKTLGIFGFGRIGEAVAKRAAAFGMNIVAYTPRPQGKNAPGVKFLPLDEMLAVSDAVTIHCPLTPLTEGIVNRDFIEKMKDGAYLINTSRGQVADEDAIAHALNTGKLGGGGFDVLSTEPPKADNPLLTAKNCYITPHIAWAGYETRERLMKIFEGNIKAFLEGSPINVING